ncbi:MAG: peptidase [Chitinophagaceae bacterium]|nr:peptidase [Chitinophagaceae bacterium]
MIVIKKIAAVSVLLCLLFSISSPAQTIPSPREHFGFNIGDDYMLANYTQVESYFNKIAEASDRVKLQPIGKTEEGRNQYIVIVSSPDNLSHLSKYQDISTKLARAEGIPEDEARQLSLEGKAVVWIDGGLHATETVGSHQLIETLYQLVSRNDAETQRILNDVIILLAQVNPDGQELVANWYMREAEPAKRKMDIPRLYQKYIGHDNNRDFYINNMSESKNISRVLYVDWIPQILYNHHQSGPAGTILAGPPYRDPFNFAYDPLVVTGIDALGVAMINRLNAENKPGFTRMNGSVYSTWWNGGLRTTAYFHNIIGLLTEITGNPAPSEIPLVPNRLTPNSATPNPVIPQKWHFRNAIDYSVSLNYAILDYASRNKDHLLYNIYKMGRNSIERGSKDHWTLTPRLIDSVKSVAQRNPKATNNAIPAAYFDSVYQNPAFRDPRGYVIPSNQKDFWTATQFVNALISSGIRVEKATAAFSVEGKDYPAGSFIIKTDQAFRPHVLDMFEPQDHPNDFQYPGGPPIRPYDAAGWTLAYQMGIQFDRILNDFRGPFITIPYGELQTAIQGVKLTPSRAGYLISPEENEAFVAVNELLKKGIEVYRVSKNESSIKAGTFYIPAKGYELLKNHSLKKGLTVHPSGKVPTSKTKISPARIALFDQYGGAIASGWARWLLERFGYSFSVIYPGEIDNGGLNKKYDILLFVDTQMPTRTTELKRTQPKSEEIPAEFRNRLGYITIEKTVPQIKQFLEQGGVVLTIGNATSLAYLLELPVQNALTTRSAAGESKSLSQNDYFIPGSILNAIIDINQPENRGMDTTADMVFNQSNVFRLNPDAVSGGLRPLAWFGEDKPLRSGWAWGQGYLKEGIIAFSMPVGKGKFYACATQITFRAQPYGTFRMLFNQLYRSL